MSQTTGDALRALEDSLKATNVLSIDYTGHVLGWAYKVAELAHDAGRKSVTELEVHEHMGRRWASAVEFLREQGGPSDCDCEGLRDACGKCVANEALRRLGAGA